MNAVARLAVPSAVPPSEVFAAQCETRALLFINGQLSRHDAVDELQSYAEQSGLIEGIGQDEVQGIMGVAFAAVDLLPELDDDELNEACEQEIMLRTADLVRQWEHADPRDGWRHTGEAPPLRTIEPAPTAAQPYRNTPQSTIDAFWYVVGLCNPERLTAWLDDHPQDASFLLKLLESK